MRRVSDAAFIEIQWSDLAPTGGAELLLAMKDEIGHSFNLAHCSGCSSIMGSATDITSCDDEAVARLHCPISPPPDSCPDPPPTFPCDQPLPETDCPYNVDPAPCQSSPLLLDLAGDGFSLTDLAGGVYFDFDGNSDQVRERLSWTAAGSDDAWLALDRNGNGTVDSSRELFGNLTPQTAAGVPPNGFIALAEYDKAERGGNGDGMIDQRDAIFARLLLWQDANHNGISEPEELQDLPASGVAAIELEYRESRRRDRHGNELRYRARVRMEGQSRPLRWAYDVFLLSEQ